jgi:hypothetical protein
LTKYTIGKSGVASSGIAREMYYALRAPGRIGFSLSLCVVFSAKKPDRLKPVLLVL